MDVDPVRLREPRDHLHVRRDAQIVRICGMVTAGIWLITLSYASVRYVVFGPWQLTNMPIYVTNKSFAWSAVVLICLSASLGPLARLYPNRFASVLWHRKYYGLLGFAFATAHICLSLLIFNYRYYREMFTYAFELTPLAEGAMAAGVLSWLVLTLPAVLSIPSVRDNMSEQWWLRIQSLTHVALLLALVHVLYGVPAWTAPENWYGSLPPITLLNALLILSVFGLRLTAHLRGQAVGGTRK